MPSTVLPIRKEHLVEETVDTYKPFTFRANILPKLVVSSVEVCCHMQLLEGCVIFNVNQFAVSFASEVAFHIGEAQRDHYQSYDSLRERYTEYVEAVRDGSFMTCQSFLSQIYPRGRFRSINPHHTHASMP